MTARRRGAMYWAAVAVLKPLLFVWTRREWRGAEHLPRDQGFLVVANHISYLDPVTLAHFLHDNGASPRFLAKEGLFHVPVVGRVLTSSQQIPVRRDSAEAGRALSRVVQAIRSGECVVIYPESTLTRDPDLWPMAGKAGAARIALETGCPVIPVAQWGIQDLLPARGKRPRLARRAHVQVSAGPALDLSGFLGEPTSSARLREMTELFQDEVTALLVDLRGEPAPDRRPGPETVRDPADDTNAGAGQDAADPGLEQREGSE